MSDEARARYKKDACQQLVMGEGWHVVLTYIVERLTILDRLLHLPLERVSAVDDRTRLAASGGYSELTALVRQVTTWAAVANPFDVHRQALWSSVAGPEVVEAQGDAVSRIEKADDAAARTILEARLAARRKRGGGAL